MGHPQLLGIKYILQYAHVIEPSFVNDKNFSFVYCRTQRWIMDAINYMKLKFLLLTKLGSIRCGYCNMCIIPNNRGLPNKIYAETSYSKEFYWTRCIQLWLISPSTHCNFITFTITTKVNVIYYVCKSLMTGDIVRSQVVVNRGELLIKAHEKREKEIFQWCHYNMYLLTMFTFINSVF